MPVSKGQGENWGQVARTYDAEYRSTVGEAFENEIRAWLARQFTDTDEVLELGCGTGIFSAMIAERVKRLTATDSSAEMLEQAMQRLGRYHNVEIRTEDAYQTSFADGSFSAVMAVNLLHHVNAPVAIARECHRVLTPGGRVVVIDCAGHGASLWSWIRTSLGNLIQRRRPPEDHHHFSPDGLASLIRDAGFSVQETTELRQRRPRMGFICLRAMKAY
jgi:ubiquinone/menaquinone biosynthesis C-methylase UbiE